MGRHHISLQKIPRFHIPPSLPRCRLGMTYFRSSTQWMYLYFALEVPDSDCRFQKLATTISPRTSRHSTTFNSIASPLTGFRLRILATYLLKADLESDRTDSERDVRRFAMEKRSSAAMSAWANFPGRR